METGAAAGEKASDRGIWSERLQQLDLADEHDSDPLLGQRLGLSGRDPGKGPVEFERLLERGHRDRDVGQIECVHVRGEGTRRHASDLLERSAT